MPLQKQRERMKIICHSMVFEFWQMIADPFPVNSTIIACLMTPSLPIEATTTAATSAAARTTTKSKEDVHWEGSVLWQPATANFHDISTPIFSTSQENSHPFGLGIGRIHLPIIDRPSVKFFIKATFLFFIQIQWNLVKF